MDSPVIPVGRIDSGSREDTRSSVVVVGECSGRWRMGSLAGIDSSQDCSSMAHFLRTGVVSFDRGRTVAARGGNRGPRLAVRD